jgi:hypothetical protein
MQARNTQTSIFQSQHAIVAVTLKIVRRPESCVCLRKDIASSNIFRPENVLLRSRNMPCIFYCMGILCMRRTDHEDMKSVPEKQADIKL